MCLCLFLSTGARAGASAGPGSYRLNRPEQAIKVHLTAEVGGQQLLANDVRYGDGGRTFALAGEGGQGVPSLFRRLTAEVEFARRHRLVWVYQPLSFASREVAQSDLRLAAVRFAAGTALDITYDFDIFRVGYQFDVLPEGRHELAVGGDLQLRSAKIGFSSVAGDAIFTQTNLGAVPLLRVRGRWALPSGWFVGAEVDGIYAPLGALRGGPASRQGALVDAACRVGTALAEGTEAFVAVRYLFGGYSGEARGVPEMLGGRVEGHNWLHVLALSLGLSLS